MRFKQITPKQAKVICNRLGLETFEDDDVKTFWASNEEETQVYIFDTNAERKEFLLKQNRV